MKKNYFAFLILLGLLSGCSQEKAPEIKNVTTPENIPTSAPVPVVLTGNGSIRGKVSLVGTPPQPFKLDMAADPVCAGAHSEPVYSQELTVGADGAVSNAFAYIKEGLPAGAVYPVPSDAVTLDQNGCRYSPHVIGVQTNQPLTIINSDTTLHNVHAELKNSNGFNLGMPLQGMKNIKKFPRPEVMAHLKCDVHPWMSAYIGIVDHPFFAVSLEDGSFEIKGIPAGSYTLSVWHEKLGVQNIPVEVKEEGVSEVLVNYNA